MGESQKNLRWVKECRHKSIYYLISFRWSLKAGKSNYRKQISSCMRLVLSVGIIAKGKKKFGDYGRLSNLILVKVTQVYALLKFIKTLPLKLCILFYINYASMRLFLKIRNEVEHTYLMPFMWLGLPRVSDYLTSL